MFISFKCDLHLKPNILNPLNIIIFKWFKKWVLCLVALSFKISRLWNFWMLWFFIKFIQGTCIFIEGGMFLLYKKFEIKCMILCLLFYYLFLKCILDTWFFLVFKTQKDINIVSKLFLNIFINLRKHHFIYWHKIVHYNYNNVR